MLKNENFYLVRRLKHAKGWKRAYADWVKDSDKCYYTHVNYMLAHGIFESPKNIEYVMNLWNDMTWYAHKHEIEGCFGWGWWLMVEHFNVDDVDWYLGDEKVSS